MEKRRQATRRRCITKPRGTTAQSKSAQGKNMKMTGTKEVLGLMAKWERTESLWNSGWLQIIPVELGGVGHRDTQMAEKRRQGVQPLREEKEQLKLMTEAVMENESETLKETGSSAFRPWKNTEQAQEEHTRG